MFHRCKTTVDCCVTQHEPLPCRFKWPYKTHISAILVTKCDLLLCLPRYWLSVSHWTWARFSQEFSSWTNFTKTTQSSTGRDAPSNSVTALSYRCCNVANRSMNSCYSTLLYRLLTLLTCGWKTGSIAVPDMPWKWLRKTTRYFQ
jgi:hypothetical protein